MISNEMLIRSRNSTCSPEVRKTVRISTLKVPIEFLAGYVHALQSPTLDAARRTRRQLSHTASQSMCRVLTTNVDIDVGIIARDCPSDLGNRDS